MSIGEVLLCRMLDKNKLIRIGEVRTNGKRVILSYVLFMNV